MSNVEAEYERVRNVHKNRARDLQRLPGYTGSATVWADPDGMGSPAEQGHLWVINVFLRSPEDLPKTSRTLDGVPLRFEVNGDWGLHVP